MIVRIVKLTIHPERTQNFEDTFNANKDKIRSFEGCNHLSLMKDVKYPNIYFTYSYWVSEKALNTYRNSELFKGIWSNTKKMMVAPPQAWSVEKLAELG